MRQRYAEALAKRLGPEQLMVVATVEGGRSDTIVGFLEAGYLPPPAGFGEEALVLDEAGAAAERGEGDGK